jgi:hypothetical protein
MCERFEDVIEQSEVIVIGMSSDLLEKKLPNLLGEHQAALDLVNIPTRQQLRCQYQGVCW